MRTPKLTAEYLRTLGACSSHMVRFESHWPDGVAVTAECVREAWADNLDVAWLCVRLEHPDLWDGFVSARDEYGRAIVSASADYKRACSAWNRAYEAYNRARDEYTGTTPLACARMIRKHLRKKGVQ